MLRAALPQALKEEVVAAHGVVPLSLIAIATNSQVPRWPRASALISPAPTTRDKQKRSSGHGARPPSKESLVVAFHASTEIHQN